MSDHNVPQAARSYTLSAIAQRFGLAIEDPGETTIHGVASLTKANAGELSFLAHIKHRQALTQSAASAVIIQAEHRQYWSGAALISNNPQADFARIASLFEYQVQTNTGIHPSAQIHPSASIGNNVNIGPHTSIGALVKIADHTTIGACCVIEDHVSIGSRSRLISRIHIGHHSQLGQNCLIHPGVVIAADGFGQAWSTDHWIKIPQLGRVIVGHNVEIGANTTIDRGALDDTVIGDGVRIDNLVQIAHNVQIGAHTAIAACVGIAGSAVIGRYCLIGGAASILGHIEICDRVVVQGMSSITHSITEAGEYGSAVAAQDVRTWRKNLARLRNLDKTIRGLIRHKKQ